MTVIATGFGAQRRRRRARAAVESGVAARRPRGREFDAGDVLDVPSFLRDE